MKSELMKILSSKQRKIVIIGIIIFSVLIAFLPLLTYDTMTNPNSLVVKKGVGAFSKEKNRDSASNGVITKKKMNKVLNYYKSFASSDSAYVNCIYKYPTLSNLLFSAYPELDINGNKKIKNADDFYKRNWVQIKHRMEDTDQEYTAQEISNAVKKAKAIKKPYSSEYSNTWTYAYKTLMFIAMLFSVFAVFMGTRIFSVENENSMNLILCTIEEQKLKNIIRNKMNVFIVFLSKMYFMSVGISSVVFFVAVGTSAWNRQLQIQYFTSLLNISFGSAYLLFILIGWLAMITIGVVTCLINTIIQKTYTSFVVGFVLFVVPFFLIRFTGLPHIIRKICMLMPINACFFEKIISSLYTYKIMFFHVLTSTGMILNLSFLSVVCMVAIEKIYTKSIREG
ncbi:MAG: hypothetical protein PHD70_02425 [Anaerostipes sp.]|jgi:hypothetical protein|nr:hypothetical protein [Anaerostipes sp.]MDD3745312.1 hypothetical protein [Anaerostipes sp.]